MIGTLDVVILDAADHRALAAFYRDLTGWTQTHADDEWITLSAGDGWKVGFKPAPDHRPPRWPGPEHPQQAHLDIRVPELHLDVLVDDLDTAEAATLALGATRAPAGGGPTFRVFLDPVGKPFCLCTEPG
jgi:predicted enzyme related to lactoylglutathione lyase